MPSNPTVQWKKINPCALDVGENRNVAGLGPALTYIPGAFRSVIDPFPNILLKTLHLSHEKLANITHDSAMRMVATDQMQEHGSGRCASLAFRDGFHCQAIWPDRAG
jgi:hypothetical protein